MKINKLLVVIPLCFSAYAFNVSKIEYIGCKRVEAETIESYLPIQVGDECDQDTINDALKALNKTGFFEKIDIKVQGSVLKVIVKEYPIINKISFEGNSRLSDSDIKKAIKLNPNEILSPSKVREIQQGLLETYRKMGRYNASVNPKIIKLKDSRVNLVFEINEGNSAGIGRIVFVGNNNISSSDLRDVIYSKVKRWYRFFVTDDIYDSDRMQEDCQAIVKYYHENGYANARVISNVAELTFDKKEFILTFTIDEGILYTFGDISVRSHVKQISEKDLGKNLYCKKRHKFNESLLQLDSTNISKLISKQGFSAIQVNPQLIKNPIKKTVNVVYNIVEGEKIYISKIVIKGNTKTRDGVIRREILLEEGDAYNKSFVGMAETKLRDLGFFQKVDIQAIPDPNSPDKCILQVEVEETPTAEAMVAASYSTTDGIGVDLTYNEKNFFGTGKALSVFLGSSKSKVGKSREIGADGKVHKISRKEKFRFLNNVQVAVSDPHIFGKDMEGTVAGHRYVSSSFDGFDVKELGGSLGLSYSLSSKFYQSWEYLAAKRKFDDVDDKASPIIKHQTMKDNYTKEGKCGISSLKHTIGFSEYFYRGLKGRFNTSLSTTIAGLGGDAKHLKNELSGSYTVPVSRKSSLTLALSTGLLSKLGGKQPHIVDSFQLGLDSFRGFEYAGFGPFSETKRQGRSPRRDFIGAKKYWKGTVEYSFPMGLPEELTFRGFAFSDFGTLWDAPDKGKKYIRDNGTCIFDDKVTGHKILDNKKIRASVGFGISFITPFGPLKLTYAIPVKKEKYDEQYRFLIGFSTTF